MNDEKAEMKKTRLSVTLPEPFMNGINEAVERGMYIDPQAAIRNYIRRGFEKDGIYPFKNEEIKEGE